VILKVTILRAENIPILLKKLARCFDVSKTVDALITLKKVARHFDAGYLATIAHFVKLQLIGRFRRYEIFRLGIADPATPPEIMAEVVSIVRSIHMQRAINPKGYDYVTEDKGVFYHYCMGADIRVPRLYAVFDPLLGWTANGELLNGKDDWVRFFRDEVPDSLVIKPTMGLQAKSVFILTRDQDAFTDHSGQRYSATDLFDVFATHTEFDRFIIQERVENHPDLIELTDTAALHTVRIVTGIDSNGEVLIFFAAQKLVGGSNLLDGFFCGAAGNYLAELSLDQGRIVKVLIGTEDGFELGVLETHPKTGHSLVNFRVPYWQATRDMVIDAARKFAPIKTIGWDVAITPDGPVIIEGNTSWGIDHFSALRNCSPFTDYAREMIETAGKD
jgi:hypothetical protein